MFNELIKKGFKTERQTELKVYYKGEELQKKFRADLVVEDIIILELKAIEHVLPVHKATLLSYMKLAKKPKGILINFHTDNVSKNAIHIVNELFANLPEE